MALTGERGEGWEMGYQGAVFRTDGETEAAELFGSINSEREDETESRQPRANNTDVEIQDPALTAELLRHSKCNVPVAARASEGDGNPMLETPTPV